MEEIDNATVVPSAKKRLIWLKQDGKTARKDTTTTEMKAESLERLRVRRAGLFQRTQV